MPHLTIKSFSELKEYMTESKSKILSLKKPLGFVKEAKLHESIGLLANQNKTLKVPLENNKNKGIPKKISFNNKFSLSQTQKSLSQKKSLKEAVKWLALKYPKCFNLENPKPLKIGIEKDIIKEGLWPHPYKVLQKALAFYVYSPLYQNALLQETKRYSLEGTHLGEVTSQHKEMAQETLQKLQASSQESSQK